MSTQDIMVRLQLPPDLIDEYEQQALSTRRTPEEVMENRLEQTVENKDSRPIYFSDQTRRELDQLLGKNVQSAEEIVKWVRRALSVRINVDGPLTIPIKPNLLTRLKSRCFGTPFPKFIAKQITEDLERFAGLR